LAREGALNADHGETVNIVDAQVELFVLFIHRTIPGKVSLLFFGGSALWGATFEATSAVFALINVCTTCHELDGESDFLTTMEKFGFREPAGFNFFQREVVDMNIFPDASIVREGDRLLWLIGKGAAWGGALLAGVD
jgi:hypothetical protein